MNSSDNSRFCYTRTIIIFRHTYHGQIRIRSGLPMIGPKWFGAINVPSTWVELLAESGLLDR